MPNLVKPEPPKPYLVTSTPLDLKLVNRNQVCGATQDAAKKMTCFGTSYQDYVPGSVDPIGQATEIFRNDQAICVRDEVGVHCWGVGRFEKSTKDLIGSTPTNRVRVTQGRLCIATAPDASGSTTITCYSTERERYNEIAQKSETYFPKPQVFGPFKNLRDFATSASQLCAVATESAGSGPIGEEKLSCTFYTDLGLNASLSTVTLPSRSLKNTKSLGYADNSVCVSDDIGVICTKGWDAASAKEFQLPPSWIGAHGFRFSYDNVCATSADGLPLCVQLETQTGKTVDSLPKDMTTALANVLAEPGAKVLRFDAGNERHCVSLSIPSVENGAPILRCWHYGAEEAMPPAAKHTQNFVAGDSVCTINKDQTVTCFDGDRIAITPLPKAADEPQYFGSCAWNSKRLICIGAKVDEDFSTIKRVVATNQAELYNTCLLVEDESGSRSIRCFGSGDLDVITQKPELSSAINGFAMANRFGCMFNDDETKCWGEPLEGEPMPNFVSTRKIKIGSEFACGLDKFGLGCWGNLTGGPYRADVVVPREFNETSGLVDFSFGVRHICVLSDRGEVSCWGANDVGQINVPKGLKGVTSIMMGDHVSCASNQEGVTCWGERIDGFAESKTK